MISLLAYNKEAQCFKCVYRSKTDLTDTGLDALQLNFNNRPNYSEISLYNIRLIDNTDLLYLFSC